MLKAINLSHSFDYELFKDINLDIKAKESVALIGRSGSGKSTLLHTLSSLLNPKNGEVKFNDKSIYTLKDRELLNIRRDKFGIIFQSHYLFRGFSAYENLEIASILSNKLIDTELLRKFRIDRILEQSIGTLSGGEQQRVSIARVLSKKPKIIFADEPTGNLDKETSKDVMNSIFDFIKEQSSALFLVTHDEKLASSCNKVYLLENLQIKLL